MVDSRERYLLEQGSRLRLTRKALGLSREAVAKAAGVSAETIRNVEEGETDPGTYTFQRIAQGLGMPADDLMPKVTPSNGGSGPPPRGNLRRAPKPIKGNSGVRAKKGTYGDTLTSVRSQFLQVA